MVRVRFAPSPTGYLHIGGVRTALFNFLYARSQKGSFLVRIEDTDQERYDPAYLEEITQSLNWLGLNSDEDLVYQSQRLQRYREVASELLEKGLAYEETKEGKVAVRFQMPKKSVKLYDLVHGETEFDTSLFDDLVIIKSDGYPTYHFACVIDDHDMQISHVIRGDDHISNTPRQMMLYEALGWKVPKYAHLPLIMGSDGAPLSKRHGAVSLSEFKRLGYLPEGLLNYLALLGWGVSDNQEFFSLEQLIKRFSLKKVGKTNAQFNQDKLDWLNGEHIKKLNDDEYEKKMSDFFVDEVKRFGEKRWRKLVLLYRTRLKKFSDLKEQAHYCFEEKIQYASEKREEFLKTPRVRDLLEEWLKDVAQLDDFEDENKLEEVTRHCAECHQVKAKEIIHPLRYAMSSETVTPGLFELLSVLGKERCLSRLQAFLGE